MGGEAAGGAGAVTAGAAAGAATAAAGAARNAATATNDQFLGGKVGSSEPVFPSLHLGDDLRPPTRARCPDSGSEPIHRGSPPLPGQFLIEFNPPKRYRTRLVFRHW